MSGRNVIISTSTLDTVSTTVSTILQVVSGSTSVVILEYWFTFFGLSAGAKPATMTLCKQTGAQSATAAGLVESADLGYGDTLDVTGVETFTSEPATTNDIIRRWAWPVYQAGYHYVAPRGNEIILGVGDSLGLRGILAAAESSVTVEAGFLVSE